MTAVRQGPFVEVISLFCCNPGDTPWGCRTGFLRTKHVWRVAAKTIATKAAPGCAQHAAGRSEVIAEPNRATFIATETPRASSGCASAGATRSRTIVSARRCRAAHRRLRHVASELRPARMRTSCSRGMRAGRLELPPCPQLQTEDEGLTTGPRRSSVLMTASVHWPPGAASTAMPGPAIGRRRRAPGPDDGQRLPEARSPSLRS